MAADLRSQQGPVEPLRAGVDPRRTGSADSPRRRGRLTKTDTELGTFDAVIIGGGVAGLWTRALLESQGRSVALLEHRALGAGQTIASQGILHAGVKYALGGRATEASRAVADVQSTWRACFRGERAPDLRTVRIAAEHMHMWTAGAGSKLAAWGAKRALRSGVRKLTDRPPAFEGAPKSVAVYEVDESLIDPASLIAALADAARGPLIRAGAAAITPATTPHDLTTIKTDAGRLEARRVILAAGAGNESLLALAGIDAAPLTQRRPLHMVVVRGAPFELFGHCLQVSEVPRLTITTSHDAGDIVWYIGGGLAEDGIERSDEAQIDAAKEELHACLPWADLISAKWGTLRVDRAEGKSPAGKRPDSVVIHEAGPVIAVWPTKLVLAPLAAQRIADLLASDDKLPAPAPVTAPSPPIALAPWESEGFRWS